ncbi:MAG TPA: hypothetical protein VK207_03725 [Bacteroidales bacterium]|nr:hypothetical protein [Bacteroidales bacterium]
MRKLIILSILILLSGCREEVPETYFTSEKASQYFNSIKELCNRDGGQLWGENLYGPLMFVDRTSRRIISNMPDTEGLLKGKDGIYTGFYPKEQLIYTAPVNFGGTAFAMVPLPPEEDELRIKTRAVHVLFHLFQQKNGFPPVLFNQRNMDYKEARLYMKLEWKALKKAIMSEGDERLIAVRDALVFRGAGRELYQKYAAEGNRFETYEGLATFTFTKLCSGSGEECRSRLIEYLDRVYSMPSYARIYGNIHGALYADLLYDAGYDLKSIKSDTTDLGRLVLETYKVELPSICRDVAGSLAFGYDLDIITKEEEERLAGIQQRLHELTSTFTEKAVVYMELESPYFDFEPENIHPVDTLGTMYSAMRVSDSWGKLTVDEGGCLVSGNYKYLRITAKGFKAEKNRISGDGWNLILNDGWELVEVKQNYFLRKMIPL